MSILYDPKEMLKKIAPERKVKKLLTKDIDLKRTALSFLSDADFIDKKSVTNVALKTVRSYQERIAKEQALAGEKSAGDKIEADIKKNPALLVARVQNEVVFQISKEIRSQYDGEFYIWLPSDADEPDPEHQLNYGKKFKIGEGEMPGERIGCRCGMEILVKENELKLD